MNPLPKLSLLLILLTVASCTPAATPTPPPTSFPTSPNPAARELPTVPPGFRLSVVYDQLELPTSIATDGTRFYVSEFKSGRVLLLQDQNSDHVFQRVTTFAEDFAAPRGIAIRPDTGEIYVASRGKIHALQDTNGDGVADTKRLVAEGFANYDVSHTNNGIAFGPDGKLYIADGAPRLKDIEKKGDAFQYEGKPLHPFAGTILVANADGSDIKVLAHGFRNPFDLAFDASGALYATDNGEDDLPGDVQGDEFNHIIAGGDYGYPAVSGPPPADSKTVAPLLNFPSHSSSDGLAYYNAPQFPTAYRDQFYIAMYAVGQKVVRAFQDPATGKWQAQDFVTGMDRAIDLVQGADGALYMLDMNSGAKFRTHNPDKPGVIYRVEYDPTQK